MYCHKCESIIDDEALICPKCGSITERCCVNFMEAAKMGNSVQDNRNFTTIKPKDNAKAFRMIAIVLGLIGCVALLIILSMG